MAADVFLFLLFLPRRASIARDCAACFIQTRPVPVLLSPVLDLLLRLVPRTDGWVNDGGRPTNRSPTSAYITALDTHPHGAPRLHPLLPSFCLPAEAERKTSHGLYAPFPPMAHWLAVEFSPDTCIPASPSTTTAGQLLVIALGALPWLLPRGCTAHSSSDATDLSCLLVLQRQVMMVHCTILSPPGPRCCALLLRKPNLNLADRPGGSKHGKHAGKHNGRLPHHVDQRRLVRDDEVTIPKVVNQVPRFDHHGRPPNRVKVRLVNADRYFVDGCLRHSSEDLDVPAWGVPLVSQSLRPRCGSWDLRGPLWQQDTDVDMLVLDALRLSRTLHEWNLEHVASRCRLA